MSAVIAAYDQPTRLARRERRAERRRLKQHDALSRQLAELHAIDALLEQAAAVVNAGWVQGAWFTVIAAGGGERDVTAYDLPLVMDRPVVSACLIGGVVQAAGGPATVRSQLVQRTLDLLWHTLRQDPERPVRWCPGPQLRAMGLLQLTHWNDAPGRTQGEVVNLLVSARRTVDVQRSMCLGRRAALALTARTTS